MAKGTLQREVSKDDRVRSLGVNSEVLSNSIIEYQSSVMTGISQRLLRMTEQEF